MQGWCRPFWGLLPWAVRGIGKRTVRKGGSFFALSRPHLMPYFAGSLCSAKGTKPPPPRPSFSPGFTIRKKSTRLCQLLEIGAPASTNLPAAAAKPPTNISDIPAQRNKTSVILLRSQGKK